MEETVRPRPSQDAKGRRCDAMCAVFSELYSRLRKELKIEVPDLNSALFSKGLISGPVLDKKDIETTLKAIMEALENESVAEKTFEGFTNVLGDISSKEHLAQAMLNNLEDKLKGQQVLYVAPKPATRQVGSTVVVNGSSYSTAGDGQLGGTVPSKSRAEGGFSSQKMPESARTTFEDSALSDEEDFTTTPQQTTDRESTDRNHGVAPEASGTLPLRVLEPQESPELEEMIKRAKQGKRTSEDMIDRRDEEIKQLHSLCKEKDEKLDKVQLQLLSNKKHYKRQIEAVEEKRRQAEEKRRLAEQKASVEKEKAGKLQQDLEQTEESIKIYIQEAADQKELAEKTEEKVKMAEEKAEELAKKLEETKDETLKYKQDAADQKELAEKTEEKAEMAEERAKMAEEKAQELAKKLEEKEKETRQYRQEAAEHKKMAEQKEEEVQQAEEKMEKLKKENAQKCMEDFDFCAKLAKQNDELVAQLLKEMTENEEL